MELSKEQIELLKLVKTNQIDTSTDYYYDNQILQDLIYKEELIEPHMIWSDKEEGLVPDSYELTVKGQNELSKAMEKNRKRINDNFTFPIISNAISAIIGIIIGAIATYFKMK